MHDSRFPVELVDGVPILAAPEEIDITIAQDLRAALLAAAAHGPGTLVADLTRTRFCDSSGLHALLAASKRTQAAGGRILLVIHRTAAPRVFEITAIDGLIPTFSSVAEALGEANGHGRASAAAGG